MTSLNEFADRIRRWNEEAGQIPVDVWGPDGQDARIFSIELICEEITEWEQALDDGDKVEALDAVCDVLFTVFGLAAKAGLTPYISKALEEVCRSNDSKFVGDRVVLPSGKMGKGTGFTPPDLLKDNDFKQFVEQGG